MSKFYFVDPQSYSNLGDYDKYLLENISDEKTFFCSDKIQYTQIENTKLVINYHYGRYKGALRVLSYIQSQRRLLKKIRDEKPNLIHFQWFKIPLYDFHLLKNIKKYCPSTKLIFTAHNILPHDSGTKYEKIFSEIYNLVDQIIVHAEITKTEIVQEFHVNKEKISVIPHGIFPAKEKTVCNKDDKVVLFSFVGFLSEYKGLDVLLKAWCENQEILNNENIQLLIAGAGKLECLDSIPRDKNIILENYFHSEHELAQIIANTDVALLPYKKISQSGVLLTYLAARKPVIVSNIGGLTQPFALGNVGWILKDLSKESIEDVVLYIIRNPSVIHEIQSNNQLWNKISDFYDWKSIGKMTHTLYNNIVYLS